MFRQLTASEQQIVRTTLTSSQLIQAAASDDALASRFQDIIAGQVRLLRLKPGEVACRSGNYGSEIYFLRDGQLREVRFDPQQVATLPDPTVRKSSEARWRFWNRRLAREEDVLVVDANVRPTLDNVAEVIEQTETAVLDASNAPAMGVFSVLTQSAFARTIFAETAVELIGMHWRAVRDLMRLSDEVLRSVSTHCGNELLDLVSSNQFDFPAFSQMPASETKQVIQAAEFRFLQGAGSGVTILRQGEAVSEVLAIASGIGRLRYIEGGRSRSVGFARRGDTIGLAALAFNATENASSPVTLDFIGHTSVLAIDAETVRKNCLPYLSAENISQSDPSAKVGNYEERITDSTLRQRSQEAPLYDFLLDHAFVRGRRTMVIDQNRCVGCDGCVKACADTHGGTPRFVRKGPVVNGYAITNACMHCEEAPCLVNCPTDAIFRKHSGEVVISEALCIGCGTCAAACPYDNIRLVELGTTIEARENSLPIALKCDLCIDEHNGPACVRACPHDALGRIDLSDRGLVSKFAAGERVRELTRHRQ